MEQRQVAFKEAIEQAQQAIGLSDAGLSRQMGFSIPYVGMVKSGKAQASRNFIRRLLVIFPQLDTAVMAYLKNTEELNDQTTNPCSAVHQPTQGQAQERT